MIGRTRIYTVHEKGGLEGQVEFVPEGFSILALIFSFLWLFWYRLWLPGLVVLALSVALIAAPDALGLSQMTGGLLRSVLAIAVALFAFDLRRAGLEARGFQEVGVTTGSSLEEAELRYFAKRLDLEAVEADVVVAGAAS
ncbi:MAG: DUF2628 domain-containing protein [Alphaproteobacteria bacterium]